MVGSSINTVAKMREAAEADIYLMGHDHHRAAAQESRLRLKANKRHAGGDMVVVKHRKQLLGRTGGFIRGYEDGVASYIADASLAPTDLGALRIDIYWRREQEYTGDPRRIPLARKSDEYLEAEAIV